MSNIIFKAKEFFSFLGPRVRRLLAGAIGVGVCWFLVDTFFILILQAFLVSMNLVDLAKLSLPGWLPISPIGASCLLVLFAGFRGIVWACKHYFAASASHAFVRSQRENILKIGLLSNQVESGNQLISTFSDHTLKAGHALFYLSHFSVATTAVCFFSLYAVYVAPVEFLMSFFLLGCLFLPLKSFDRKVKALAASIVNERNAVTSTLVNGLKNKFFLKISGMVDYEFLQGSLSLARTENHYREYEKIAAMRSAIPICVGGTLVGVIYWISSSYIHTAPSKLLIFFYMLLRVAQSFSEVVSSGGEVQINLNGFRVLIDLSSREAQQVNKLVSKSDRADMNVSSLQSITLEDVGFGYNSKWLFRNINIALKKSQSLLIVGESGSGKSTLLSLMAGLVSPKEGRVLMDGQNAMDYFINNTDKIAYVGPEAFFIAGTLRSNLLYGHPNPNDVSNERIWNVLKMIGIEQLVLNLPKQLDEYLYDQAQISTGQKQRLSIVRALLRGPEILFLDEATANLDHKTELSIIDALKPQMEEMITVIISHKNTFNSVVDFVIQLAEKPHS